MGWSEMTALHRVARLEEVTLHGAVSPEIHDWRAESTLSVRIHDGTAFVAGVQR